MSTATYRSHQQTSRELDELDALVQRMLSTPFSADEPEKQESSKAAALSLEQFAPLPPTMKSPAPPVRTAVDKSVVYAWRAELPAAVAPPLDEPPMALPVDTGEPVGMAEPRFFAPTAFPVAPTYSPPVLPAPVPYPYSVVFGQPIAAPMQPVPVSAPPTTTIPSPQWQAPKQPVREPLPFVLWPVYLLNKIFDLLSYFLGPLGTWLRQSSGRNVLGWLGILMVLGAIGWGAADWYGLDWIK